MKYRHLDQGLRNCLSLPGFLQPRLWGSLSFCCLLLAVLSSTITSAFATSHSRSLEPVTLQLKWFHQFQFAGYYAAYHKGFYRDEGLDVTIKSGGPDIDVDEEVLSGRADFGVLGSELIQKKAKGQPLVLLAVIMQHSVRSIIVRADSDIYSPADFVGKTIMLNPNEDAEFWAMFASEGIDFDKLNVLDKDKTANSRFINNSVDGINGSIGNQPYIFAQKNIAIRTIRPITYGIDFYGDSLFTSGDNVNRYPERIARFRRATLLGWEYAMAHAEEMASLIVDKYNTGKDRSQLLSEAEALRKLILPDLVEIGHVNPNRINRIAEIYEQRGIIPHAYSLEGFVYDPDTESKDVYRLVVFLALALVAAGLSGGVLFLFNTRLKRKVAERTEELHKTNTQLNREIEEKEKVEGKLRSINSLLEAVVEGTTDAIFIKDLKGKYMLVNTACLEAMGMDKEEVIGRGDSEIFPQKSAEIISEVDMRVLASNSTIMAEERLETAYGDTFWLANKSPYRNPDGELIGLVGISRNITEIKRSEEEKINLQERLLQAQKMESIGTLAGGIAHDFNNILAAILGYAELVKEDVYEAGDTAIHINEVISAAHRAKFLVQQILMFSRKSQNFKFSAVNLSEIVDEVMNLIRATIPATIEIRKNIEARDRRIIADATQMHQVLMNLCTNASQAMEQRGGLLTVELSEVNLNFEDLSDNPYLKEGKYLKLTVSDTGSGIEEELLDRVFEPYFTTKDVGEGSGMGLAVVLGIVKSHNGLIKVDSDRQQGATFSLFFPVTDVGAADSDLPASMLPTGEERILVVDDEKTMAEMTRIRIDRLGYEVTAVTDSTEALNIIRNDPGRFDLVVTDQTMPNLTGDQLVKEIFALRPDLPVILCTGFSSRVDKNKARNLGVKAFLMKPMDRELLAKTIRRILDGEPVNRP